VGRGGRRLRGKSRFSAQSRELEKGWTVRRSTILEGAAYNSRLKLGASLRHRVRKGEGLGQAVSGNRGQAKRKNERGNWVET